MHLQTEKLLQHTDVKRHSILAEAHRLAMEASRKGTDSYRHHYEQMSKHNDFIHIFMKKRGRASPFVRYEAAQSARDLYAHSKKAHSKMSFASESLNRKFVSTLEKARFIFRGK